VPATGLAAGVCATWPGPCDRGGSGDDPCCGAAFSRRKPLPTVGAVPMPGGVGIIRFCAERGPCDWPRKH
jgi:hypothetical protein